MSSVDTTDFSFITKTAVIVIYESCCPAQLQLYLLSIVCVL